ncbi:MULTISPECIES: hypothetical protein [Helicobacter]|uniref:hypothetical protein n=1 Tax=Helicobacter TaxID=209 RepID=UPI00202A48F1|nr:MULTISPECIES: hypothetical protein [Helicobacter]MCI7047908.1 hypothetical protein [Helicobacter sp.]MCL9822069.1 hypothetical protein [Helicobacter colisuis]MDY5615681.1 hypothetical protein [Helicobacter sp.]
MTKRDMAAFLGVDVQTLRNWKKTRPNLYRVILQGLAIDEAINESYEIFHKLANFSENAEKKVLKSDLNVVDLYAKFKKNHSNLD